ncbi:MAG: tRNA (adenosine(37)-N6)-dimethylallyltransferase MiaA [Bacteroides sp.]|nr:tRNA (adenosine(37)-N6)-dimethylallyltransferase MiaA [Bacteroides sp.]
MKYDILAIVGPTASGKTGRAVDLAHAFDGEIISGDSRQVYVGMDLGTGKDLDEYGDVPYHLIDILPAGEKYNLYGYLRDYEKAVAEIEMRKKLPILCGGTGMYVESALTGMRLPEVPENKELRESLKGKTLEELAQILASMKTLHNVTDIDTEKRAIRAIEIQTYYKEHPDEAPSQGSNDSPGRRSFLVVGVDIDRENRRRRISERLCKRLDSGMVDEVRGLIESGVDPENLIYYGLEYKYLTLYVTGKMTYSQMVEELEIAIHQFAKRQMTWFRGMERRGIPITWLPYDLSQEEFVERVKALIAD